MFELGCASDAVAGCVRKSREARACDMLPSALMIPGRPSELGGKQCRNVAD